MLRNTRRWMNNFVQRLKIKVPRQSAKLSKSIKGYLSGDPTGKVLIEIEALEYFAYQDQGVSGVQKKFNTPFSYKDKRPPARVFKPYTDSVSEQFAMASHIYKNGIKPKNVLQPALKAYLPDLPEALLEDFLIATKLK